LPSPPKRRPFGVPRDLVFFVEEEIKAEAKRQASGVVSLKTIRAPPTTAK